MLRMSSSKGDERKLTEEEERYNNKPEEKERVSKQDVSQLHHPQTRV